MQLLKAPKTKYKSYHDIGKFNMIWNVCLILIPVFFILLSIHFCFNDDSVWTSLMAFLVASVSLGVLYRTRKFEVVGLTSVILGTLICQATIFVINDSHIVSDTMWCVLVSFFTFFLFGVRFGIVILLLNLSGLVIFLLNGSANDIFEKGLSADQVDARMVINVFYVGLTLAFVIYKMVENNNEINARYEKEIQRNEILIKEIHHRVKNNLQIISSLLRLQAAESTDETIVDQFNEAINRIRSMALIHEKMYHDDDLSSIDIPVYLEALAKDIVSSTQNDCQITFSSESKVHNIDIENIVPLSLIFNELITNSLKHGFLNKKEGNIKVEIKHFDNRILFHYQDDGDWKEPSSEKTFGSELMEILTDQLDGVMTRELDNGTHFYFEFESKLFFSENQV